MKRKIILIIILGIMLLSLVYAEEWPSFNVCCEKTDSGAWCQNTLEENCDTSNDDLTGNKFRVSPTSCGATSFCNPGCCIDSEEGLCMKNTPKRVCEIEGGSWLDDKECNVPQCSLGCCILGDQSSFVTSTRCKRLSSLFGLETNFKRDVANESACILMAYYQDKGACVYETIDERKCVLTTRERCLNLNKEGNSSLDTEFYKDYLCSADELNTDCRPTEETICVEGKYEVYFKDSCGNPANIYDANKIYSKDKSYWQKIVSKSESCNSDDANINSRDCGNCNYLQGSICGEGNAEIGDYICQDLNCYNTENGKDYRNGESWCEYQSDTGEGRDAVGSRQFRHVCIHGEEVIEPCADFRNEICVEDYIEDSDFLEASCAVNRWQDCLDQFTEEACLNTDKRDCMWIKGAEYDGSQSEENVKKLANRDQNESSGIAILEDRYICLPDVPPGLKFWEESDAQNICSLGNSRQIVKHEENIFGKRTCIENCDTLQGGWVDKMNQVCTRLGDCGAYHNFINDYTDEGILWKIEGKRQTIQEGILSRYK